MNTLADIPKLPKRYSISTDVGRLLFSATYPKAEYLFACLREVGIELISPSPMETLLSDSFFEAQGYDLTQFITIINSDTQDALYVIQGSTEMLLATVGTLLSTMFTRHEVQLIKNRRIYARYINGQAFH
jgi:hypothetical protein